MIIMSTQLLTYFQDPPLTLHNSKEIYIFYHDIGKWIKSISSWLSYQLMDLSFEISLLFFYHSDKQPSFSKKKSSQSPRLMKRLSLVFVPWAKQPQRNFALYYPLWPASRHAPFIESWIGKRWQVTKNVYSSCQGGLSYLSIYYRR